MDYKLEEFTLDVDGTEYFCTHEFVGDRSRKAQNDRNDGAFDRNVVSNIKNWIEEGRNEGMIPYNAFECAIHFSPEEQPEGTTDYRETAKLINTKKKGE